MVLELLGSTGFNRLRGVGVARDAGGSGPSLWGNTRRPRHLPTEG